MIKESPTPAFLVEVLTELKWMLLDYFFEYCPVCGGYMLWQNKGTFTRIGKICIECLFQVPSDAKKV
ncbi:MAG: hypothetical protein JSW41_03060 [Candidatus Aenigmatarchaeota archaeon]|nr:MAG: hypothetical protein JSW41_03060 [Candidatus Aenigmarchaeota archaeon]